jgi:hypothetical protein
MLLCFQDHTHLDSLDLCNTSKYALRTDCKRIKFMNCPA